MAKLTRSTGSGGGGDYSWNLEDYNDGEPGMYPGILLDIREREGVEKRDFNDPSKMVERDITRFLFAYTDDDGEVALASTMEMTISGSEKSTLFKLLTKIRGSEPPVNDDNYDTTDEIGRKVLVTITQRTSKKGTDYVFAETATKCPVKKEKLCPDLDIEVPGGRVTPIPDWMTEEEEPVKPKKSRATSKKAPKKVVQDEDEDEEDPF